MGQIRRGVTLLTAVVVLAASASAKPPWTGFRAVHGQAANREDAIHRAATFLVAAGYDVESPTAGVLVTEWRSGAEKGSYVRWSVAVDSDGWITVDIPCRYGGGDCGEARPGNVDWNAEATALANIVAGDRGGVAARRRPRPRPKVCFSVDNGSPNCFATAEGCEAERRQFEGPTTSECAPE